MRFLKAITTLGLILTAYAGDYVVFRSKFSSSLTFRAISDSLVHAAIGFLSSILFFSHEFNISIQGRVLNVLLCTFVSSLIDVDHVFVAKSFHLKDMTGLKQRGIFHCTTFWLLITISLLSYSYVTKKLNIYILSFMLTLAYTSHHIRDANRRGFWLYPFGHTPPLNKHLYVFLTVILPYSLSYIYMGCKHSFYRNIVVNYNKLSMDSLTV